MPRHATKTSFKKGHKSNLGRKFPQLTGDNNVARRPEVREKIRQANLKRWANQKYRNRVCEAMRKPHLKSRGTNHSQWIGGCEAYWRSKAKKIVNKHTSLNLTKINMQKKRNSDSSY